MDTLDNCTAPAINNFPSDFFTQQQRLSGGVIIHILITVYVFASLAVVCDDYFTASLEKLCSALNLQPDVAGATFMAAGSSAPELFTAVIGVFITQGDIGVGTIAGSAAFNILVIILLCGLFGGSVINLLWFPLTRDCLAYLICIIALVLVLYDERILWYEALTFVVLYCGYLILMYFNARIQEWCEKHITSQILLGKKYWEYHKLDNDGETDVEQCSNVKVCLTDSESTPLLKERPRSYSTAQPCVAETNLVSHRPRSKTVDIYQHHRDDSIHHGIYHHDHATHGGEVLHGNLSSMKSEEYVSPFEVPQSVWRRILWFILLPVVFLFFCTIPDCRRPFWQNWFVLTFTNSVIWIAVLSYIMVWMVTIIGYTFGIPDTVMGLTFLAAGTSVPDAIASLLVARDGYGDMAVSNSVGSNVFDILVCLGVPWLIKSVASQEHVVVIKSSGLTFTATALLVTVLFLLFSVRLNNWKLDRKHGFACLLVYAIFLVFSCLYELNIFTYINPPMCKNNE